MRYLLVNQHRAWERYDEQIFETTDSEIIADKFINKHRPYAIIMDGPCLSIYICEGNNILNKISISGYHPVTKEIVVSILKESSFIDRRSEFGTTENIRMRE